VALSIVLLLTSVLAGAARPAREAFERVPAELDLQQRARTAIDAVSQPLRSSIATEVAPDGQSIAVTLPVPFGGQGIVAVDQATAADALELSPVSCPNLNDVCGFSVGTIARVTDPVGHSDLLTIGALSTAPRSVTPGQGLSQSYPAGSTIVAVDRYTFRLAPQADGSFSLVRQTAAGAIQPIADFVSGLTFVAGSGSVEISIRVHPADEPTVPSQTFRAVVATRNAS